MSLPAPAPYFCASAAESNVCTKRKMVDCSVKITESLGKTYLFTSLQGERHTTQELESSSFSITSVCLSEAKPLLFAPLWTSLPSHYRLTESKTSGKAMAVQDYRHSQVNFILTQLYELLGLGVLPLKNHTCSQSLEASYVHIST